MDIVALYDQLCASFASLFAAKPLLWPALAGCLGACLASFFGVLVDRMPHTAGWRPEPKPDVNLSSPSRCEACGARVGALALVPVLGWLLYRGKCCRCGAHVPWAYPATEAATAALSVGVALAFGPGQIGTLGLVATWVAVLLAWIDWREAWLPDCFTETAAVLGLLVSPFGGDALSRIEGLAACTGIIIAAFALLGAVRGQSVFAGGDVRFFAMAGAWLGFGPGMLEFVLAGALLHACLGGVLWATGSRWEHSDGKMRELMREEMGEGAFYPMGPSLSAAFVFCVLLAT
jgi:leader peptidase (prepilin peptidase)/N-methyltransferase